MIRKGFFKYNSVTTWNISGSNEDIRCQEDLFSLLCNIFLNWRSKVDDVLTNTDFIRKANDPQMSWREALRSMCLQDSAQAKLSVSQLTNFYPWAFFIHIFHNSFMYFWKVFCTKMKSCFNSIVHDLWKCWCVIYTGGGEAAVLVFTAPFGHGQVGCGRVNLGGLWTSKQVLWGRESKPWGLRLPISYFLIYPTGDSSVVFGKAHYLPLVEKLAARWIAHITWECSCWIANQG